MSCCRYRVALDKRCVEVVIDQSEEYSLVQRVEVEVAVDTRPGSNFGVREAKSAYSFWVNGRNSYAYGRLAIALLRQYWLDGAAKAKAHKEI